MNRSLDQLAEIAQKAVGIGNSLIKDTRPRSVTEKSDRDTFTDVDIQIEHEIRAYLADVTPDIGFIGEEEGPSNLASNSRYIWALDPIDGTANFSHGIPLCATQLALMEDDVAIIGTVALPYLDRNYIAISGQGAYVNGSRIQASKTSRLSNAIVSIGDYATGNDAPAKNATRIAITASLAQHVERVRMFGSAAHDLVWVAEGITDAAVISSNRTLDLAAGALIAREAGASVTDSSGRPHSEESKDIVACAQPLLQDLLRVVLSNDGRNH